MLRAARLDLAPIRACDGWCDEPGDRNYNRKVCLPYDGCHESLARSDHLYDTVIVLDFNICRRMQVGGSGIFFHLARSKYTPTEGCVAISSSDMDWLLPRVGPRTVMVIS